MGKIVIPIGMSMGVNLTSPTTGTFDLMMGDNLEKLGAEEWTFWLLAHNNEQAHYEHRFDRAAYAKLIDEEQPDMFKSDKQRIIDKLFELGALVEVDLKNESPEPFFRKYTLLPSGVSFGNTADDQTLYGLGVGKEAEVWVNGWCHTIWAAAHRNGSLWNTCAEMAKVYDEDDDVTTIKVAKDFAEVLPIIVAAGCGFLEPVE